MNKIRIGNRFTFDVKIYKVESGANVMLDLNLYLDSLSVSLFNIQNGAIMLCSYTITEDGYLRVLVVKDSQKKIGRYNVKLTFDEYTFDAPAFELVSSSVFATENLTGHSTGNVTIELEHAVCGLLTLSSASIIDVTTPSTDTDIENMLVMIFHKVHKKWMVVPASIFRTQYNAISTYVNDATFGTITQTQSVTSGSTAIIYAYPSSGYRLVHWVIDGNIVAGSSSYTFSNITEDHTIQAVFEVIPVYTIVATSGEGFSITPAGTASVQEGASKTFSITPADGYNLSKLIVDGVEISARTNYTFSAVSTNHTISAIAVVASNPIMYYGYATQAQSNITINNSGTWTYSLINLASIQAAITAGTMVQTSAQMLDKTALNNVPEGCFIIVALPKNSLLTCKKDDGIGNKVAWNCDFNASYASNGIEVAINGVIYELYGEYATVLGTRYIYIDNK